MIADIAVALFFVASAVALVRLVRGPSLADRVIALDVTLVALMGGVAVRSAADGSTTWLGLLAVIAIVAFLATVAMSRFIEQAGRT